MTSGVDAIVVGAGHNGLICAAYLARAGLRTVLVEARDSVGGCASTVDALGGRVNICNCDHTVVRSTPVIDELGLSDHGLQYLDVDPPQLAMGYDGAPAWVVFHDLERTLDGLRLTYPGEVDNYRRYAAAARPIAELALEAALQPPTRRGLTRLVAGRRAAVLPRMLRWNRMSAAAVLRSFFRTDEIVAPSMVVAPGVWGLSPHTPGTGLGALAFAMKHVARTGRPVGGSGRLTDAIAAAFTAAGGDIRCGSAAAAILCEGSRVRGVELADGTVIEAPVVVSAADPHRTFLSWLRDPPATAQPLVERWRRTPVADGYESKLDAITAEAPIYRALDPKLPERLGFDPAHATTIVAPPVDEIHAAHAIAANGGVAPRPLLLVNVPSALDPTMHLPGPDGGHVLSLEVLYTPYALKGGWPTSSEPARWLELYRPLVQPGFVDGVRRWRAMTPDRYESEFHMPRGHATSFGGGALAAFLGRQPELTRYETPVQGLFLTGAATFPGAGVWGASGRNAATVVLASR